MATEFALSPRTLNILTGRGMKLFCSASKCLFETDIKDFGREIEVKGYAICPNCKGKATYPNDRFSDDGSRTTYWKCPICSQTIPNSCEVWTQIVVAKHYGKKTYGKPRKHIYYHKECDEARYIEVSDSDEQQA